MLTINEEAIEESTDCFAELGPQDVSVTVGCDHQVADGERPSARGITPRICYRHEDFSNDNFATTMVAIVNAIHVKVP